jgi:CheY-like chemotaxis protein
VTRQLSIFGSRQKVRTEVLNPNEVITNLDGLIGKAAGEQLQVATALSPVLWPAYVDRTQFETALLNLVINAREAMNETGTLRIETGNVVLDDQAFTELPAGDYLRIAATDTGPGMPPETVAHAFDPFFAANDAGKESALGLSQVYSFARRAGGQVRLESKPGEGTRVEIYLPKSVARTPQPEEVLALPPIRASLRAEMVLVVEDNADVLDVAVSGLTELGYRVKTATDAQAALNILRNDAEIEVLFSDVAMPGGMNGGQLASEAQRIRPGLKVLLTSGYTASALSQQHGLPETLQVLPKPYHRDELASKLRLVIGDKDKSVAGRAATG